MYLEPKSTVKKTPNKYFLWCLEVAPKAFHITKNQTTIVQIASLC